MDSRTTSALSLCSVLVLVLGAVPAAADNCDNDSDNLLAGANCGFDTDLALWVPAFGSFVHDASRGEPQAGSLAMDGHDFGNGFEADIDSACVRATGGLDVGFGARFRLDSGIFSGGACLVVLMEFSDLGCIAGLASVDGSEIEPDSASWSISNGSRTLAGGTVAVALKLHCSSLPGNDFIMLADNAFIGENLTIPVELLELAIE